MSSGEIPASTIEAFSKNDVTSWENQKSYIEIRSDLFWKRVLVEEAGGAVLETNDTAAPQPSPSNSGRALSMIQSSLLLYPFYTLVHEMGHALMQKAMGCGKVKIMLERDGSSGMTFCQYPKKYEDIPWKRTLVSLAGPLANIVVSTAILVSLCVIGRYLHISKIDRCICCWEH